MIKIFDLTNGAPSKLQTQTIQTINFMEKGSPDIICSFVAGETTMPPPHHQSGRSLTPNSRASSADNKHFHFTGELFSHNFCEFLVTFIFLDYYKLENDHLGSGAYASVRTAKSCSTGKEYAVKVVNKHEDGHTRSRLLREVQIFKICKNHPNIVQLIEWFEDDTYVRDLLHY